MSFSSESTDLEISFFENRRNKILEWLFGILLLYIIVFYIWKRRWLYYYGWKLPGPLALPLIGNAYFLLAPPKNIYKIISRMFTRYSPICRLWIDTLYVGSCRPKDLEIILPRCLDKGDFYFFVKDVLKDSAIIAPLPMWKKQRKILDETLKPKMVNSFFSIFLRESLQLCQSLEEKKPIDVFLKMWYFVTRASCETLGGVHPNILSGKKQSIIDILRYEEIVIQRYFNPLLYSDFAWKFSSLKPEFDKVVRRNNAFSEKVFVANRQVAEKMQLENNEVDNNEANQFSQELITTLAGTAIPIASETTGIALSSVLLMLGMHPEVQEKVLEELSTVFANSDQVLTMEDLNRLDYLERVIKESLRLLSPIPLILRELHQDVKLDSYVLPKGTRFFVIMEHLHRNPEYWPDPLKFDPDRFLPEISAKRHRFAFIPFSLGSRNCPGSKYAMLLMKIALCTILRCYKVSKSLDYNTVEEIEFTFTLVDRATKGYRIILEKRIQ